MWSRRALLTLVALMGSLSWGGCRSVGPKTIAKDQFDYSAAVAESWKRQMLLNIVKMRYGEPPVFLEVASVINQYSLEGQVSGGAAFGAGLTGNDTYNLGANAKWADRPTITYNPLSGDQFTRSLLTPVPPDRIMWLLQSGYKAEFVLSLSTRSINGVRNHIDMEGMHHAADPDWEELLAAMTRLQQSSSLGMRLQPSAAGPTAALFFHRGIDRSLLRDLAFVLKTMDLDRDTNEFQIVFGLPRNRSEIALETRSLIEMMMELGASVEVPETHLQEGRARPVAHHDGEEHGLMSIKSGPQPPDSTFVSAEFDGYWYWIDRGDLKSKQTLTFMMFLSSIAETGSAVPAPIVTVSAGQ